MWGPLQVLLQLPVPVLERLLAGCAPGLPPPANPAAEPALKRSTALTLAAWSTSAECKQQVRVAIGLSHVSWLLPDILACMDQQDEACAGVSVSSPWCMATQACRDPTVLIHLGSPP